MKIKKKDLRKREAQLPINYPNPEVEELNTINDAFFHAENTRVEELCKRLAHNEVAVRDKVLAELPRYIKDVTRRIAAAEEQTDMNALQRLVAMRASRNNSGRRNKKEKEKNDMKKKKKSKKNNKKDDTNNDNDNNDNNKNNGEETEEKTGRINVLREVTLYRSREENVRREQRRQEALQRLKEEQEQEQQKEQQKYDEEEEEYYNTNETEKEAEDEIYTHDTTMGLSVDDTPETNRKSLRQMHREWITVWADTELLLLKLARGVFFCLWHSDKPLVQLECARRIAQLIHAPRTNSGKILFFSCLMRVLAREWRSMDRYRADKFLALVRKMVYELAQLLKTLELETKQQQQQQQKERKEDGKADNKMHKTSSAASKHTLTTGGVGSSNSNSTSTSTSNNNNSNSSSNNTNISKKKSKKEENGEDQYHHYDNHDNNDNDDILQCDPLCRALDEACYVFQEQIVPVATAVGLTMHIADILFDELCRAALSPTLFVALSDRIALYAMSQGNFVEKRVLDYFVAPIAGGVLATRRLEQQQQEKEKEKEGKGKTTTEVSIKKRKRQEDHDNGNTEQQEKAAAAAAEAETNAILFALAECCKQYAVGRNTVRPVRVMFTESEMALRQAADPSEYRELTRGEMRRRVEREVKDVEELRHAVVEERRKMRVLKKKEKRYQMKSGASDDDDDNDGNNDNEGEEGTAAGGKRITKRKKVTRESSEKGKKKQPRNTKRKKHYTLTRKDLYSEE